MYRRCLTALLLAHSCFASPAAADSQFTRGDVTSNGAIDLVDAIALLGYLFVPNAAVPVCLDAGDTNDDGAVGIPDAVGLLSYLFVPGSSVPASPFPGCGNDPTIDSVSCVDTNSCTTTTVWSVGPPLLTPRGAHCSATVGALTYLFGGGHHWSGGATSAVQVYNAVTATWSTGTPVPDANTWGATAEVVGGRVYLIGGHPSGGTSTRSYDPVTDSWQALAPSPINFKWGHASAVVGNLIFVTGGIPAGLSHGIYDTVADTWTTGASPPSISQRVRAEAIDGLIYMVGTADRKLQIYDPTLNAWTLGPSVPTQAQAPATLVRNGELWVLGGSTLDPSTGGNLSALQIFDPVGQVWSQGPSMPTCRSWASAELIDDDVHVFGGLNSLNEALGAHEVLD